MYAKVNLLTVLVDSLVASQNTGVYMFYFTCRGIFLTFFQFTCTSSIWKEYSFPHMPGKTIRGTGTGSRKGVHGEGTYLVVVCSEMYTYHVIINLS